MMRVMHAQFANIRVGRRREREQLPSWRACNSAQRPLRVGQVGSLFWIEFSGCGKADLQSVGHVFEQVSAMSPGWTPDPAIIFLTKKILARKMDPRVEPAGEDQTTLGAR